MSSAAVVAAWSASKREERTLYSPQNDPRYAGQYSSPAPKYKHQSQADAENIARWNQLKAAYDPDHGHQSAESKIMHDEQAAKLDAAIRESERTAGGQEGIADPLITGTFTPGAPPANAAEWHALLMRVAEQCDTLDLILSVVNTDCDITAVRSVFGNGADQEPIFNVGYQTTDCLARGPLYSVACALASIAREQAIKAQRLQALVEWKQQKIDEEMAAMEAQHEREQMPETVKVLKAQVEALCGQIAAANSGMGANLWRPKSRCTALCARRGFFASCRRRTLS